MEMEMDGAARETETHRTYALRVYRSGNFNDVRRRGVYGRFDSHCLRLGGPESSN